MKSKQPIMQRAIVTLGGTDDKQIPVQQVFYQGKAADAEVVFPYGMHANMVPIETLCMVFSVNNEEDYRTVMGYTPNLRPTPLEVGEVVFYHPVTQSKIHFKNNGDIDIQTIDGAEGTGGNLNMTITRDLTVVIGGNASITTEGDASITSGGDTNVTTSGNTTIDTTGNTTIDTTGTTDISSTGAIDVTSSAALSLTGTTVSIEATSGDVSVDGSGIKLNAPTDVDGDLDVNGDSTADDHISGTISGNSHIHGGVTTGAGTSGGPI